jgi:hypothetical protein
MQQCEHGTKVHPAAGCDRNATMMARLRLVLTACALAAVSCATAGDRLRRRGIIVGYPSNWHVRLRAPAQEVPAAALGLTDDRAVTPGELWLVVGSVTYPIIKAAGATTMRLVTPAEIGRELGEYDERPSYALGGDYRAGTWFTGDVRIAIVAAEALRPLIRASVGPGTEHTLRIHLVAPSECSPATPDEFRIDGIDARDRDGTATVYAGPFRIVLTVDAGYCVLL